MQNKTIFCNDPQRRTIYNSQERAKNQTILCVPSSAEVEAVDDEGCECNGESHCKGHDELRCDFLEVLDATPGIVIVDLASHAHVVHTANLIATVPIDSVAAIVVAFLLVDWR